jgi:mannosyl-3-phosphoglycerate phosphatase
MRFHFKASLLKMKHIVFTDLDGTLLDPVTYSYEKSLDGISRLKESDIPLIFCSAKTRAEQEVYRRKIGVFYPFIVENGGAIFIPQGYFPFPFQHHKTAGDFLVIELGTSYKEIRKLLDKVRKDGNFQFRGFGDMSIEEIAQVTGLDIESAKLAKQREYDETVVIAVSRSPEPKLRAEGVANSEGEAKQSHITPEEVEKFLKKIKEAGLNYAHGGRFYDIMGDNDKGKAVTIMSNLYRQTWGELETIGLGDSLNDLPMLSAVDIPILVQKGDYSWESINIPRLRKVHGVGPEGWSRAIEEIF